MPTPMTTKKYPTIMEMSAGLLIVTVSAITAPKSKNTPKPGLLRLLRGHVPLIYLKLFIE